MIVRAIFSFGYRHGKPEVPDGATVIDVRTLFGRNPYHDKRLRRLRGTDRAVQADIRKTPGFERKLELLAAQVKAAGGLVYLGCTGGHHRSVYLAELLSERFSCPVQHLNINHR